MNNIVFVNFECNESTKVVAQKIWQYDYGQILRIQGLNLPAAVEIHFSLQKTGGIAERRIGVTRDGVTDVVIPDFILKGEGIERNYSAYAFIYLSDEESGQTEHRIELNITSRPEPEGSTGSNETSFGAIMDALKTFAAGKADGLKYENSILKLMSGETELARVTITGGGSGGTAREIELQKSDAAIQWRYVGDEEWTDLVLLEELKGDPGDGVSDEKIQEAVNTYLKENPIEVEETDPTVPDWAKAKQKPSYTASEVGAEETGTAESKVSEHNTSTESHNDIRLLITNLTKTVTSLLDSDDETLNQTSEIVAYTKSNKSLIDAITTSKVSVSDIVNNLTTSLSNKALSAEQGVVLKGLIDTVQAELNKIEIPTTLPNPNALTIKCGDREVVYDGTKEIELEIEENSGGDNIDVDAELKEYMNTVKPKIKQAIINKGGSVQETDSFGDYATRIDEIPNGVYAAEDLPTQTILTATYSATNPSGITLNFADVGADGYLIVKKTGAKPETSADGTIVYNGVHTTDVLDEDVTIGNVYYYRIYPRNSKNQYQSLEEQSVAVCDYKSRDTQKQAKDLALDESVAMGYYNNQVFIWKVVDTQDGAGPMMAAEQNCGNKQWDSPENDTDNPNPVTVRKTSGNNRWCYSNIRQWLNSDVEAGAWYSAQHEYDVAPSYKTEAGFLNGFTEIEKEAIVVKTNTCILDSNDGGGTETVQDTIWLPSSCEMGKEVTCEGYNFEKYDGTNASTTYTSNYWMRTINNALTTAESACNVRYVGSGGSLYVSNVANGNYAARPFCQLREDAWLVWSDVLEAYILADDSQRTWEA